MRVRVFNDPDNLAVAAATEIAGWLRFDTPHPTVGLSGGSTPRLAYERLRTLEAPRYVISSEAPRQYQGRRRRRCIRDHSAHHVFAFPG